jgi:hypothetical protein
VQIIAEEMPMSPLACARIAIFLGLVLPLAGAGARGAEEIPLGSYNFVWEGRVDGSDYLFVRGDSVWVRHLESRPIEEARYSFRTTLPARSQMVQMDVQQGRGRVSIEEQPSSRNNYTLKILLDDTRRNGSDMYRLGLRWEGGADAGNWTRPSGEYRGLIRWRGTVDGRDRLYFSRQTVDVRHMDAQPIRNMRVEFSAPVPREAVVVRLTVVKGRGAVRLIDQPDRRNGFTIEVEVDDPQGGDDDYEFDLTWQ